MQRGFTNIRGENVPFAEIDPIQDAASFNCSPATLTMLLRSARERQHLPDGITASQAGAEIRQLYLMETADWYQTTDAAISAYSGTLKHEQINVDSEGLIVEQRFVSTRNPRISGKIDHAAKVDVGGEMFVDLWDLKTAKWYAVTLMVKDLWKNKPDYAWQLSLCAELMEEAGYKVRNVYLECVPADASYNNIEEAKKLGVDFRKVIVPVTRKSTEEVYNHYEELLRRKDEARTSGYAPLCKERWSNKKVSDLRCRFYCSVVEECKAFSLKHNEIHPLA